MNSSASIDNAGRLSLAPCEAVCDGASEMPAVTGGPSMYDCVSLAPCAAVYNGVSEMLAATSGPSMYDCLSLAQCEAVHNGVSEMLAATGGPSMYDCLSPAPCEAVYNGFIAPAEYPVYPSHPVGHLSESPMRSGVGSKRMACLSPALALADDVGFRGRRYSQIDDARAARFYRVHQWGGGDDILIDPAFPGQRGSDAWQRAAGAEIRRGQHKHPERLFTNVNGSFMLGQVIGIGLQDYRGSTAVINAVDMYGFLPGEGGPVSPAYSPVPRAVRERSWSPVPDAEQGRRASSVELSVGRQLLFAGRADPSGGGYTPVEPSQSPVYPTYNFFLTGDSRLQIPSVGMRDSESSLSSGWVQGSTSGVEAPEVLDPGSLPASPQDEESDSWDTEDSPSIAAHDGDYGFTYSPPPRVSPPTNDVIRTGVQALLRETDLEGTGMTFRELRRQLESNLGLPEGCLNSHRFLIRRWIDEHYEVDQPQP